VTPQPPRNLKPDANLTVDPSLREGSPDDHATSGGSQGDSKLELFGFDSLVNILGLKSMTGEQIQAPSSPRDGEDVAITIGRPKETGPKFGTMMGVFVPCLQNILGIIYYIRFTW
jgi:potassium/chloride transporter 4/5/6